jgi:UDP-N-acetyl-D-galactosamine dehydrogenase
LPGRIAVIGLGYVGLPLAVAFSRRFHVTGFDIDPTRIAELAAGRDRLRQVPDDSPSGGRIVFTSREADLADADFFVVTVPTPVDVAKQPDLRPLLRASEYVGRALKTKRARVRGGNVRRRRAEAFLPTVVYESTVYPGCTEEVCVPALEEASGLVWRTDFNVGYSPERINPGDPAHTLSTVIKIVSGDCVETAELVARTYALVATAGVHRAPDIKTAEAAKVIENVQRDLNIALINELAILFDRMGVRTREVLEAASTKWNFARFEPGLVGGHCIPVDPYYLTYKAEVLEYHPDVILAGRRINDSIPGYVAKQTLRQTVLAGHAPVKARALVLGVTFKEDVGDTRNSGAAKLASELAGTGMQVWVHDPMVEESALRSLGLNVTASPFSNSRARYDVLVLAVAHRQFLEQPPGSYLRLLTKAANTQPVLIDVKSKLSWAHGIPPDRLRYWSLM